MNIHIKRIYDEASLADGYRILVDRLWPRGVKKENAKLDLWAKDIAPATELRQWFNHKPFFCADTDTAQNTISIFATKNLLNILLKLVHIIAYFFTS